MQQKDFSGKLNVKLLSRIISLVLRNNWLDKILGGIVGASHTYKPDSSPRPATYVFEMGSLSSLLFAVAFFVGNRECHSLKVTETYYKQNSLTDCLHKFNLVADIHVKSLKEDLIEGLEEGTVATSLL